MSRWLASRKSGANDRFLVNPTIRWRGQEWLLRVDSGGSIAIARVTASGASSSLPDAPAKVPSQSDLPTFVTVYRGPQPTPWRAA